MYELIHAERGNIPVARACRVLGVVRSGYYEWLRAEPSARSIDDAVLAAEVSEFSRAFEAHHGYAPERRQAANVARNASLRPLGGRSVCRLHV